MRLVDIHRYLDNLCSELMFEHDYFSNWEIVVMEDHFRLTGDIEGCAVDILVMASGACSIYFDHYLVDEFNLNQ